MTRATLIAALMTALLSGPSFAAGAPAEDEEPAAEVDEDMLPHPVTLPGSYVALPEAIVVKIRDKILIERGETPEDHDDGGH